jgi:hypothetical protein
MFNKSKNFSDEYCCTVVKIGPVQEIENSDFLGVVDIEGKSIVVRKDQVKEGDIMFYVSNECQINNEFLSAINAFSNKSLNKDPEKKGYFSDTGRVRMIRLRGILSMGFLFTLEDLKQYKSDIQTTLFVGECFDMIGNDWFVKPYIPKIQQKSKQKQSKPKTKSKKYDRIVPGQFEFHYNTSQLAKNIHWFKPTDIVSITNKLHGTSFICGNILVKKPKWGGLYEKIFLHLPKLLQFTKEEYDIIYSSRTVIKNQYINPTVSGGYYNCDIWGIWAEKLRHYIPKGMTIYGEIIGYLPNGTMIQKGYDYGCKIGESKLMIYRITKEGKEYNISEVLEFTKNLIDYMFSELNSDSNYILPIEIFYQGPLGDLYPELSLTEHWQESLLSKLKTSFGLEELEPQCKNKVPREGIVIRIQDDPLKEAFKLKALRFLEKEAQAVDKGELNDIETIEHYSE